MVCELEDAFKTTLLCKMKTRATEKSDKWESIHSHMMSINGCGCLGAMRYKVSTRFVST